MSELIITQQRGRFRLQLLTTASALSLLTAAAPHAMSKEADRPIVWIELGGQLSAMQDKQEVYAPPFVALTPAGFPPPQKAEKSSKYGLDETAALTFQPKNSDWMFSAAIRYGRTSSDKQAHHQTYPNPYVLHGTVIRTNDPVSSFSTFTTLPFAARFTDASVKQNESRMILDFQAGKDVGLGLFGGNAISSLEFGVRFAQFTSKSQMELKEDPDFHFNVYTQTFVIPPRPPRPGRTIILQSASQAFHSYISRLEADRSFHGVGPSIAWKSSLPVAGHPQDGELRFDWGVNAAVLFGRQKARVQHQTTGYYGYGTFYQYRNQTSHHSTHHTRSRAVVVPNVGGFAGLSFRYSNAKIALGYRADFFFGAMDGGIDARKTYDRNFYGPFATISIGLGG